MSPAWRADAALPDQDLQLVRRHGYMAALVSLVHSIICLAYFLGGYFKADTSLFILIFAIVWLGNLLFYKAGSRGWLQRAPETALALPFALWLAASFLVTAWFVDDFRISVVMPFFGAMLLASFHCRMWQVGVLSAFTGVGYILVLIFAFADRGIELSLSIEVLQWLIFSLSCGGFVITGASIHQLRQDLTSRNRDLREALHQVHEMAIRDELTGLYNRRFIFEELRRLKRIADGGGPGFCVCYLDLDWFKEINDTFGHGVGDRVLQRFAELMNGSVRESDFTARLGGEEFLLVLVRAGLADADQVTSRLRALLGSADFTDLAPTLRVTVSVGVAAYRRGEDIEHTLTRADGCLYQAKQDGRDRVVLES